MFDRMPMAGAGHLHPLLRLKLPVLGLGFWTPSLVLRMGLFSLNVS